MPQDSVLKGRLEGFRPAELLQVMGLNASSGTLHLHSRDDRTGLIYVDAGSIVGSIEMDTEALTLGHVLQQLNMATAAQLDRAYLMQTARSSWQTHWRTTDRSQHSGPRSTDDCAQNTGALDVARDGVVA